MAARRNQNSGGLWAVARDQHGVVTRTQLLGFGLTPSAIKHRLSKGRLYRVGHAVYAVGRPELTQYGWWMAAVLSCGPQALLSHESAAALWAIRPEPGLRTRSPRIDVSVPAHVSRRREGIRLHRRTDLPADDRARHEGIPVTSPARTLIDLGTRLRANQLEAAVNQADKLDLIDPEVLRSAVDEHAGFDGVALLRKILDRRTFTLTD